MMPRTRRPDAPGEIHHVWVRGLERRAIFIDRADRLDLLDRLSTVLPDSDIGCLAWALLPNHFHLVLKRGAVSVSRAMARINTGYALRFNRKHDRVGFLFQNRFGSRIVDDDADLIAVVRYVCRNPLKHDVCADEEQLSRYEWSSHSGAVGNRSAFAFEDLTATRRILDGRGQAAPTRPYEAMIPDTSASQSGWSDWVTRVCIDLDVDPDALGRGDRGRASEARAALCWIAVTQLGLSGREAGSRLGVTRSAVSRLLAQGRGRTAAERVVASSRSGRVSAIKSTSQPTSPSR